MPRATKIVRLATTLLSISSVVLVSGCAIGGGDGDDAAPGLSPTTPASANPLAAGDDISEDTDADGEAGDPLQLPPLNEDEMMEVLLASSDLLRPPQGHSTQTGPSYFRENIAVDSEVYEDTFGVNECTTALDTINKKLIGRGAANGVLHEYRRERSDGTPELLFVWALSYPEDVDTSDIWQNLLAVCEGTELSTDTDVVEIAGFSQEPFSGIELGIRSVNEPDDHPPGGYAAAADFGPNLVMVSSVNMSGEDFSAAVETQATKIAEYLDDLRN